MESTGAIIDEKLEMQNLFQLARTTLTQVKKTEIDFVYPEGGLYRAWVEVARAIEALGSTMHTGVGAELVADPETSAWSRCAPGRRATSRPR